MLKHEHLLIRAEVANPPSSLASTERWLNTLIDDLGMEVMIGPFGEYSTLEGNEGLTIGACITTSHIMMHVWDRCEPAVLQLDVYSCREVDPSTVMTALEKFMPTKVEYKFLDRENGFLEISC